MIWTYESILKQAPDAITFERGKELASLRHWKELVGNSHFVAGLCKSTGNQVYQTFVDLDTGSSLCSCSSEKSPCRHVIALMLYFLQSSHNIYIVDRLPDWLPELRQKAEIKKTVDQEKLAQQERAKAKTRDARFLAMQYGVQELETWLFDLMRQGLAAMEVQSTSFWEDFAARMVDAKLGAIGKRIRLFAPMLQQEDWQDKLLRNLAEFYLFTKAFKKLEYLPEGMQQELLNYAGVTVNKDTLLSQKGISDKWLVLGKKQGVEENLLFRRTWLLGEETGQLALILDFVWGRNSFPMDWKAGHVLDAELVYYPAAYQVRAVLKKFQVSKAHFLNFKGYPSIEVFAKVYAKAVALNPWISNFPAALDQVRPYYEKDVFRLIDAEGKSIPLQISGNQGWRLLAISGGTSIQLFGEWNDHALQPISAFVKNRLVNL